MLDRCQAGKPSANSGGAPPGTSISGVDILVNNAGIQHTARTEVFPPQKWDDLLSVNLSAAFHTTRLALPKMQRQSWGRIVNVASIHGKVASVEKSAYCASKFGIIGLTKVGDTIYDREKRRSCSISFLCFPPDSMSSSSLENNTWTAKGE